MKIFIFILTLTSLTSCMKSINADLVIHNARIHAMDDGNQTFQAIAIKDGKILELGAERQILNKYNAQETIDAAGKTIYPGFVDAHAHLMMYAKMKLSVMLFGSKSMDQLLAWTEKYTSKSNRKFILGYGWDQSLWGETELPNNQRLNELFPNKPVCLFRVDGHTVLANDAALKLAKITPESSFYGGMVEVKDGKCTGILVDNAVNAVLEKIPPYTIQERTNAVIDIQNELLQYGLVGVHEAGITNEELMLFKKMVDKKELLLEVYAMLLDSPQNRKFVEKNGHIDWGNVYVRSFKMFADGALGSRGALLKAPYSDAHNHFGVQTTSPVDMENLANFCLKHNYQLNSHAIGDSSNSILLNLYKKAADQNTDHRWRIEHAQIVDPKDFNLFAKYGIIPSVQPTHAVSDQRWAKNRLGEERMKGAYAYQSLLKQTGILAIGTDFPVELPNPFLTIFAATQRKNADNQPIDGFLANEAISLYDCMKGMTLWAANASFRELKTGSLEKGKDATLVILNHPLTSGSTFKENYANRTIIRGKTVYSAE